MRLHATLFPLMLSMIAPAAASQIALGVDSRHGIFVQERWERGVPFLCIANASGVDHVIGVSRWQSRQLPPEPLFDWRSESGSTDCHEASPLLGEWLIALSTEDGQRLGLMKAPSIRDREPASQLTVAGTGGVNGVCPVPEIRMTTADLWAVAGETLIADLWIRKDTKLSRIEFPIDSGLGLPHLRVDAASSPRVSVQRSEQRLVIDLQPGTPRADYALQLTLSMPEVARPALFQLSGQLRTVDGISRCFVQGIPVKPTAH